MGRHRRLADFESLGKQPFETYSEMVNALPLGFFKLMGAGFGQELTKLDMDNGMTSVRGRKQ